MIRRHAFARIGAAIVFAGLDAVWLCATNARLYRPVLHAILSDGARPIPAALFYLLYVTGLTVFAVAPALRVGRWTTAARTGALFGLFAYATYDLTNQATLTVWATRITVLDLCWGCVVSAAGATAGYFAGRWADRHGA